jgi:polar amino acid transport system substrate-binding protein
MSLRTTFVLTALASVALVLPACGDDDESADTGDTSSSATTAATDTSGTSDTTGGDACTADDLPLKEDGTLTVATGDPAFPPWVIDDDPTNEEGFEAAVVYAIADQWGLDHENVAWVRAGFDESISPGEKDYDMNIQQYSITPERAEVVDFSTGYYEVEQALVAAADSSIAGATSIEELKDAKLGAAIGSTSLDYIDEVIQPSSEAAVFDDNAAAKAAFDAGQVDGLVFDVPTAYYITSVEIPDSTIVGILPPAGGEPEEMGILFEKGSPLVSCVDSALAALRDAGDLEALEDEWLNQGGDIPTLSE